MTELVRKLAAETGLSLNDVRIIMISAPVRYKVYFIPKRNGEKREIAQPAREVKLLQRALMRTLLIRLPIHNCATAYRKGLSIADNAGPHAGIGRPLLKMDFRDFFPSIRQYDWRAYCCELPDFLDEEDIRLTSNLLFRRDKGSSSMRLAIGAPSSPMLSNILLYEFDDKVSSAIAKDKVVYTRYADDLTFSAPRTGYLTGVMKTVADIIRKMKRPRLEINSEKTVYATSKFHRSVTGLVLSNDGRVTIGREKKRQIHAAVHHATQQRLSQDDLQTLAGLLAHVNSVEPAFILSLRNKYGDAVIEAIQRTVIIGARRATLESGS